MGLRRGECASPSRNNSQRLLIVPSENLLNKHSRMKDKEKARCMKVIAWRAFVDEEKKSGLGMLDFDQ